MRRVAIIFVFIVAIISYHNVIFASYNSEVIEEELHQQVEQIFQKRSRIWNQFLIGQYTSVAQLEEELKIIVTNPLFKSDVKMFEQMLSSPTSYEGICDVSIQNIDTIKNNSKKAKLEVVILWEIEGYENNYNEEIKYIVEMEKYRENWLLSNYEVSE